MAALFAPPGSRWLKLGQEAVEALLAEHYEERRLHIKKEDDLEKQVQLILEKDLGDFCWSLDFEADFVRRLFTHGFLPICTSFPGRGPDNFFVLLPKLHRTRCILQSLSDMKVDRGARKRSRKFFFTVDAAFDGVIEGCIEQHGESWLWPPVRETFHTLLQQQEQRRGEGGERGAELWGQAVIHSIEVWLETAEGDPRLAAGELGYECGALYTSLTGFYREAGAGTVQMLALAGILLRAGFQCWDFGMNMAYKAELGATELPREQFVALQRSLRTCPPMCRADGAIVRLPAATLPQGIRASELIGELRSAKGAVEDGAAPESAKAKAARHAGGLSADTAGPENKQFQSL